MKGNCHNSRTSDDISMKLEPIKKLNLTRETKQRQKKLEDNAMSGNCKIIAIFRIYGQFGAIQNLDSGLIVCKTYFH